MISAVCDFARADWQAPIARHGTTVIAGLLCFFAGLPAARIGGAIDLPDTDHTQLRLIAAQAATGKDSELRLGLHFRLDPGWKIYWRTPGDAGIPPVFDWSGSHNVAAATVEWPIPKRFSFYGMETFGYQDEVVLPVKVRLAQSGGPASVRVAVKYAACAQICVPLEASLALDLPSGPTRTTPFARLIARYAAQVPTRGEVDGFAILTAIAQGEGREKSLEITASAAAPFVRPDLIVEAPRQFLFARPRVQISEDGRRAVFEIAVDTGNKSRPLVGVPLVVTLIDGSRAIERAIVAALGS